MYPSGQGETYAGAVAVCGLVLAHPHIKPIAMPQAAIAAILMYAFLMLESILIAVIVSWAFGHIIVKMIHVFIDWECRRSMRPVQRERLIQEMLNRQRLSTQLPRKES